MNLHNDSLEHGDESKKGIGKNNIFSVGLCVLRIFNYNTFMFNLLESMFRCVGVSTTEGKVPVRLYS